MIKPSDQFHYDPAFAEAFEPSAPFHYELVFKASDHFRYDAAFERIVDAGPAYCHHIMMTYDAAPVADEPIIVLARDVTS